MAEYSDYDREQTTLKSGVHSSMPNNEITEYGVLVSLVSNNGNRWDELSIELSPEDFYDANHNLIFKELLKLADANENLVGYTVGTRISERRGYDHPAVRIAVGLDSEHTLSDPLVLIKQLKTYTLRRRLISNLAAATEKAYDLSEENPGILIDEVIQKIGDSDDLLTREKIQDMAMPNFLGVIREDLDFIKEHGHPRQYLHTGFDHLDHATWGGLRPGHLYVLAGRPGTGKTSLAINICENILFKQNEMKGQEDMTIAFFSLEQTAKEIATKILSGMTNIPYGKFQIGGMTPNEEATVDQAFAQIEKDFNNFVLINPTGLTISDFKHSVKQAKRTYGCLDLVVLDYVGLMSPEAKRNYQNRATEIADITRSMKLLAIEEEIPILLLAQVNRNPEGRGITKPRLSDLRDSGAIEQDADFVMFLYKEEDPKVKPDYNKVELIIAKNRHGALANVNLQFNSEITVFTEHDSLVEDQSSEPAYDEEDTPY